MRLRPEERRVLGAQLRDQLGDRKPAALAAVVMGPGPAVLVDDLVSRRAVVLDDAHRRCRKDLERLQRALDRPMTRDLTADDLLNLLMRALAVVRVEIGSTGHAR